MKITRFLAVSVAVAAMIWVGGCASAGVGSGNKDDDKNGETEQADGTDGADATDAALADGADGADATGGGDGTDGGPGTVDKPDNVGCQYDKAQKGKVLGKHVKNFILSMNEAKKPYQLHQNCGEKKVVYLILATGW